MSAEEHERNEGINRKRIIDQLRLYENIWKTRQKIVYNDQVQIGHFIHYIQNNENSKKNNKSVKKKNK